MTSFKNVLLPYLEKNKDNKDFDVDYNVFKGFPKEDVATIFEELINTGQIKGYVSRKYYAPHIFIEKIYWKYFQDKLKS